MSKKNVMLWAWVDREVRELVEKLAESQGISLSEYLRQLVIQDLDKRNVFTAKLKKGLEEAISQPNPKAPSSTGGGAEIG